VRRDPPLSKGSAEGVGVRFSSKLARQPPGGYAGGMGVPCNLLPTIRYKAFLPRRSL
jgi:hypothetical protein